MPECCNVCNVCLNFNKKFFCVKLHSHPSHKFWRALWTEILFWMMITLNYLKYNVSILIQNNFVLYRPPLDYEKYNFWIMMQNLAYSSWKHIWKCSRDMNWEKCLFITWHITQLRPSNVKKIQFPKLSKSAFIDI